MRVGVILAARGPVPYLAEALESVLAQEPGPDEVVLVDHASDPALTVPGGVAVTAAGEPAVTVPRGVRLVRPDDPAGGPAAAREAGLAELSTELVALADADDVWEPGKLRAQVDALAAHPQAAVCFGRAHVIDAAGRETGERLPELPGGLLAAEVLRRPLYAENAIPAASTMIRREALEAVGGFTPQEPLPAGGGLGLWVRPLGAGEAIVGGARG